MQRQLLSDSDVRPTTESPIPIIQNETAEAGPLDGLPPQLARSETALTFALETTAPPPQEEIQEIFEEFTHLHHSKLEAPKGAELRYLKGYLKMMFVRQAIALDLDCRTNSERCTKTELREAELAVVSASKAYIINALGEQWKKCMGKAEKILARQSNEGWEYYEELRRADEQEAYEASILNPRVRRHTNVLKAQKKMEEISRDLQAL